MCKIRIGSLLLGIILGILLCLVIFVYHNGDELKFAWLMQQYQNAEKQFCQELSTVLGAETETDWDNIDKNGLLNNYYSSTDEPYYHYNELRLIPTFNKGEQPNWDDTSHWLCYFAEYDPDTFSWSAADFQAAADKLLADYTVPRENSAYVTYDSENDRFVSTGWDDHGGQYYYIEGVGLHGFLDESSIIPRQVYEMNCSVAIYNIDEMWFDEDWNSGSSSSAALKAYALHMGYTEENLYQLNVQEAMRDLVASERGVYIKNEYGEILRLKPEEKLQPNETLNVVMQLSGDEHLPFTYTEAQRTTVF